MQIYDLKEEKESRKRKEDDEKRDIASHSTHRISIYIFKTIDDDHNKIEIKLKRYCTIMYHCILSFRENSHEVVYASYIKSSLLLD